MMVAQPAATALPVPALATNEKLRILLLAAALIKLISSASDAAVLFGDTSDIATVTLAGLALVPPLAAAALVFAGRGNIAAAICAMAATILCYWLGDMVAFVLNGLGTGDSAGLTLFMLLPIVGYPLMAACAIALAARGRSLGWAAALVIAPMIISAVDIAAFTAAIAIHGF